MRLGTGVDIIRIDRIRHMINRHGERFYQRFFTDQERLYCGQRHEAMAARIAAKEAVAKALGTGIGDVRWLDIEVIIDERGKPEVILHGAASELAQELGLNQWALSLSHSDDSAVAFVVALGE